METNEEKIFRLEYYQELLLNIAKENSSPFYVLIISNKLSKNEVEEIFQLCEALNDKYKQQKEEGFVNFLPLLTHFVGMLNYKIDPHKTIDALYKQGIYKELMNEFYNTIKKSNISLSPSSNSRQ